jgi:hypothetical protein
MVAGKPGYPLAEDWKQIPVSHLTQVSI